MESQSRLQKHREWWPCCDQTEHTSSTDLLINHLCLQQASTADRTPDAVVYPAFPSWQTDVDQIGAALTSQQELELKTVGIDLINKQSQPGSPWPAENGKRQGQPSAALRPIAIQNKPDTSTVWPNPGQCGQESPPLRPHTPASADSAAVGRSAQGPTRLRSDNLSSHLSCLQHTTQDTWSQPLQTNSSRPSCAYGTSLQQCQQALRAGIIHYAAVFLDSASKKELCDRVPPMLKKRSCDHMTLIFEPSEAITAALPLGRTVRLSVVGVVCDAEVQAVIVEPPDFLAEISPAAPHITISVAANVQNKQAGALVSQALHGHLDQPGHFQPCHYPWTLTGTVGVRTTDGRVLVSHEDVRQAAHLSALLDALEAASETSSAAPGAQLQQPAATHWDNPPEQQQPSHARTNYYGSIRPRPAVSDPPVSAASKPVTIKQRPAAATEVQAILQAWQAPASSPVTPSIIQPLTQQHAGPSWQEAPGPTAPVPADTLPQQQQQQSQHQAHALQLPPPSRGSSKSRSRRRQQAAGSTGSTEASDADVSDRDASRPRRRAHAQKQQPVPSPASTLLPPASTPSSSNWWEDLDLEEDAASDNTPCSTRIMPHVTPPRSSTAPVSRLAAVASSDSAPPKAQPGRQDAQGLLSAWTQFCPSARAAQPSAAPAPVPMQSQETAAIKPRGGSACVQERSMMQRLKGEASEVRAVSIAFSSSPSDASDNERITLKPQWRESEGDAGEARSLPDLADQAGPLDEASAKAQAQAAVNQRTATSLLADAERRLADTHAASAAVFQRAAKDAFDKGEKEIGKELAGKSREHAALAADARSRANAGAYKAHNTGITNRFRIDLHGLHVDEALAMLDRHLANLGGLSHPGGILLQVVTGVGRHSAGGQPRILPAVVSSLRGSGLRFWSQPDNAGMIEVLIPGQNE